MPDPRDLIQKKMEEILQVKNAYLHEYILLYLQQTKSRIEDLTIVEDHTNPLKILFYLARKDQIHAHGQTPNTDVPKRPDSGFDERIQSDIPVVRRDSSGPGVSGESRAEESSQEGGRREGGVQDGIRSGVPISGEETEFERSWKKLCADHSNLPYDIHYSIGTLQPVVNESGGGIDKGSGKDSGDHTEGSRGSGEENPRHDFGGDGS